MDFRIPEHLGEMLDELDSFIEAEIKPLEEEHERFFDHRRENARTNWDDGTPTEEWEALLDEMRHRADEAGFYRYMLPEKYGGQDGSNLGMALIREHLANKGVGLHNVLQQEAAIVGNFNVPELLIEFASEERTERHIEDLITGETTAAFGLSEPEHGSDVTHMDTTAEKDGDEWIINGAKRWNSGLHIADYDLIFARTAGEDGDREGITGFWVPTDTDGLEVDYFHWTFNMPTDHAEVTLDDVRVPDDAILGDEGDGLRQASYFVHEGRIRQAASSVGAAQYCIERAVDYARERETWDEPLAQRQGIQFPLADLHTEAELIRNLVYKTAWMLDEGSQQSVSDRVSMANYRANLLACNAADRAMQVFGGRGYTRHEPFEHIYRHHRRYRITEGSEEIMKRNVAGHLFGYIG